MAAHHTLGALCRLLGAAPNPERVRFWVAHGLRVRASQKKVV